MGDQFSYVLAMTVLSSGALVLAIILVLARSRTLETRLILIGVFMAVAAAAQGNFAVLTPDPGRVAFAGGLAAGSLMRVATLLILSGVALAVLTREVPPAVAANRGEETHGV